MKFGFEREFFILKDGEQELVQDSLVLCPADVPHDDNHILAEARGEWARDIVLAAFNLEAAVWRIKQTLKEKHPGLKLDEGRDYATVSKALRFEARRLSGKGPNRFQNLYGHTHHKTKLTEMTAGMHLSVTAQGSYNERVGKNEWKLREYNKLWDFPRFVRAMDKRFAEEIKEAKRRPGFYELKGDGRFEYRSLPQSVPVLEVAQFVQEMQPWNW